MFIHIKKYIIIYYNIINNNTDIEIYSWLQWLAYILNLVLVSMMSLFTTTGSMPLLVEIYFPEGITSPDELSLIWLYL